MVSNDPGGTPPSPGGLATVYSPDEPPEGECVVTADDLRRLIAYLEERVEPASGSSSAMKFELPGRESMLAAGLHPEAVQRLLDAPWLQEMVSEVLETPEFCAPDDPPDQVLRYARDVVGEYIRKRFSL